MKCIAGPSRGCPDSDILIRSALCSTFPPHTPSRRLQVSFPYLNSISINPNPLPGSAPDRLEEAVLLCEPVEAVVALAHGADEAAEGVDLVVAGVAAVLIDLADADLDGSVVLGLDDASGSRLCRRLVSRFGGWKDGSRGHLRICGGRKLRFVSTACVWCGVRKRAMRRSCSIMPGQHLRSTSSPRSFSIVNRLGG